MYQNYDKMREVEKEISILKNEKYDDLTTPVDAFITFEAEDGFIMAMEFEERKNGSINETKIFMNIPLVLDDAPEPTNIIWENRHLSDEDYLKRGLQVFTMVIFLLAISFTTIFLCKNFQLNKVSKYPQLSNNQKLDFLAEYSNIALMQELALEEYAEYETIKAEVDNGSRATPFTGIYVTYCSTFTDLAEGSKQIFTRDEKDVCKNYEVDKFDTYVKWEMIIKIGIIMINFILRKVIISLIIYIGKDTQSEQALLITNGVFIVQFFNTAFLLLMVNANMSEQGSFLGIFSRAKGYPDFNSQWFSNIGATLIGAMMFNVYWPLFEFITWSSLRATFRLLD